LPVYRIIAKGASGGLGIGNPSLANGGGAAGSVSLTGYGARIRAVFPLTAGTLIYFLVGQEGAAGGIAQRDVRIPPTHPPTPAQTALLPFIYWLNDSYPLV